MHPGFARHFAACNNAELPGRRLPFRIGATRLGYVLPDFADSLAAFDGITREDGEVTLTARAAADLQKIARALAEAGHYRWRSEAFDVRDRPDGEVLTILDRGALPAFGVQASGVHMNGLVRRADGLHLWVARRSADRLLDPGKLDHIAAGGVPAGMAPDEAMVKEAAEEAAIPPDLSRTAIRHGTIAYVMERPEGLRRDLIHCYDLNLPEDFVPRAADGEVAGFELWPIERVQAAVRDTDDFKFNINLVLVDLFERLGI